MALNLRKRDLTKYDLEAHTDRSRSMFTKDRPGGESRWNFAKGWVTTFVQEAEKFDDDGPTVGFFDDEFDVYENTTFARVGHVFNEVGPRGSTDTAKVIRERCGDYLDQRLGTPGTKGFLGIGGHKAIPADPTVKPRIILIVTDGAPNDQHELENEIVTVTKRMKAGGLTKDDLVISFVQVGNDSGAKKALQTLNDGLEAKGAAMDIVGCITCDEARGLTTQKLLEAALDAE